MAAMLVPHVVVTPLTIKAIMRDVNLKMSGHDYHPERDVRYKNK